MNETKEQRPITSLIVIMIVMSVISFSVLVIVLSLYACLFPFDIDTIP